jgi:hypothetical protein
MVMAFWDSEGVIFLDVMQREMTVNSDTYIYQHAEEIKCFQHVQPVLDKNLNCITSLIYFIFIRR